MSRSFLDRCISSRQRVGVAFALVAVLAACGSGGGDDPTPTPPPPPDPSPSPPPPPPSQQFVIDFGERPALDVAGTFPHCTSDRDGTGPIVECPSPNGFWLSQDFADVPGISDVSFLQPRLSVPPQAPWSLGWYREGYNDLYGFACTATSSSVGSQGRIDIRAVDSRAVVKLDSFYLGGSGAPGHRSTTANVFALDSGALLFTYSGPVGTVDGTVRGAASQFTPGVEAAGGIRIEWQDTSFYVCIDRITHSVTVP